MTLKLILISLIAGPTLFLCVILFLMTQSHGNPVAKYTNPDYSFVHVMTLTAMTLTVFSNAIAPLFQKLTVKMKFRSGPFLAIQSGLLTRYAMAEGAALFGLVNILLGIKSGITPAYIWVNLIPLLILYLTAFFTFPTRMKVEEQIKKYSEKYN